MGAPQGLCPAQLAHNQAALGHPSYEVGGLELRLNPHQATLTSPNIQTADANTNARGFKGHCTREATYTCTAWVETLDSETCPFNGSQPTGCSLIGISVMSTLVFSVQSSNPILAASKRKNTNWRLSEEANRRSQWAARPACQRVTTWKKKRKKGSQTHVREHLWNGRKERQEKMWTDRMIGKPNISF